jgi:hypothetical protein
MADAKAAGPTARISKESSVRIGLGRRRERVETEIGFPESAKEALERISAMGSIARH